MSKFETSTNSPRRRAFRRAIAAAALLAVATLSAPAAASPAQAAPRFDAYPAGRTYTGPVNKVDFNSHKAGYGLRAGLRAIVREEAAKGPNFAGAYRLVTVGCGTACQVVLVVDLRTGCLHAAPKAATAGVAFRRHSRLVRFNADRMHGTPARYYVFRDGRFRPVR